jgi:hypothetical protein
LHCGGTLFGMRDKGYEARVVAQGFEIWIVGNPQIGIDTQAMIDCFAEEWERLIRPPQFRFQSAQGIECSRSVWMLWSKHTPPNFQNLSKQFLRLGEMTLIGEDARQVAD